MLDIKLTYAVNDDVNILTVTDATGAYSASNTGGWGAPNTARNDVALVLFAEYQPYEKDSVNLSLTTALNPVVLYDPAYQNDEVSEYTFTYTLDGWYKFSLVAVPTSNGTPEENDIIYDTVEEELRIYKTDTFVALESADWQFLKDEQYESLIQENLLFPKLIIQRNCQLEKYIACMECTSCKCEKIKEEYVRLDALIQASDYRFASQKENEAQRMIEKLTKEYNCCN